MKYQVFNIFPNQPIAESIQQRFPLAAGRAILHTFPDKESLLQIQSQIENQDILIVSSLSNPNEKIFPLLLFANMAKDLGAKSIGLLAPYLAYMRQDKSFHPGEAISARYFAKILSGNFDWLLTIDPHLHRFHDLQEIYSIPTKVVPAALSIAQWIASNVHKPLLIGPDIESTQWVNSIASIAEAPFEILSKVRHGDHDVTVTIPNISKYSGYTPVLIDDIIATGKTMIATLRHLESSKLQPAICIAVHAIFANNSYLELQQAGASQIISCNTIAHISNKIDLTQSVLDQL